MAKKKAVLVDIDGTLVDSNDAHASAWLEALREAGRSTPFDEIRRRIGKGGDKLLAEVAGLSDDSQEGAAISERRTSVEAIGLRCGGWPAGALRGAIAVYDSAADLFARYDTSPFSRLT
jgi:phosphoglycolate phosphatase-like HAD superfamily hydrolase